MSAPQILLIEDNPLNRKLLVRFLGNRGFEVHEVENTLDAEAWMTERQPAVILVDVSLPGEDGLSFVRRMRARPGFDTPVIAVTAHAMTGDDDKAIAAGCDAYLAKPVDLPMLLGLVQSYCARRGTP